MPYSYSLIRKHDNAVVGHAALSPPNSEGLTPTFWTKLKLGFYFAPFYLGFTAFNRFQEGVVHFKRPKEAENCWNLEAVAIDPSERGKGLGHSFMKQLLKETIPKGQSVYMATQREGLARFYSKLGFKTFSQGEKNVAECKFSNWFMKKD